MENEANNRISEDYIGELISLQNESVKNEVQSALDESLKKYDADVFGFGQLIYETKPQLWSKVSKSWREELKTLPVNIMVDSKLLNVGLTD